VIVPHENLSDHWHQFYNLRMGYNEMVQIRVRSGPLWNFSTPLFSKNVPELNCQSSTLLSVCSPVNFNNGIMSVI
jgi:hypothetical protein